MVSRVVAEVVEVSEAVEAVLAALEVEEAPVSSARRVVSIWAREEEETAEMDISETFRGLESLAYMEMSADGSKTLVDEGGPCAGSYWG